MIPDAPNLFDFAEARAARDAALVQVNEHADPDWKEAAYDAVVATAYARARFTADDIYDRLDGSVSTHEPRALGPVMLRAVRSGLIAKANVASIPSRRRSLHASPRTVWDSLIHHNK